MRVGPKSQSITHHRPHRASEIPAEGWGYFTCQTRFFLKFYFNEESQTDNRSMEARQQFPLQVITQSGHVGGIMSAY